MTTSKLRIGGAALAAATLLALAACSQPAQSENSAAASDDPSASSQSPTSGSPDASATPAPSSDAPAASSGSPAASSGAAASTPATSAPAPVNKPTVEAKGDAAKDSPQSWPSEYRVAKKAETKGVDHVLEATKKAADVPASVRKKAEGAKPDYRPTPPDFGPLVEGAALSELQGNYVEAAQNGWVTTGEPKVVGDPRVVDLGSGKVRVFTCMDFSAIEIKDAGGKVYQPKAKAGTRQALQIYDMRLDKDKYVIVSHQVAATPSC